MSDKKRSLCEYKKDEVKEKLEDLKKIVSEPKFICRKCARSAKSEEYLCKPEKI